MKKDKSIHYRDAVLESFLRTHTGRGKKSGGGGPLNLDSSTLGLCNFLVYPLCVHLSYPLSS